MPIDYNTWFNSQHRINITFKEELFLEAVFQGRLLVDCSNGLVKNSLTGKLYSTIGNKGYIDIGLKYNGITRHMLAHRLVWLIAYGPVPEPYELNHIDGNKTNNKLSNLEMVTGSENVQHAFKTGLIDLEKTRESLKKYYSNHIGPSARLTKQQVYDIIQLYNSGTMTIREIGSMYNISHSEIVRINKGIQYKAYTNGKPEYMINPLIENTINEFEQSLRKIF